MKRMNFPHRKTKRREEAEARQATYNKIHGTPEERRKTNPKNKKNKKNAHEKGIDSRMRENRNTE